MAVLVGRTLVANGETLVNVKGRSDCSINVSTELGLAEGPITMTMKFNHDDVNVNAWGSKIPVDVQWMLAEVQVSMDLIHVDKSVLAVCQQLSMGFPTTFGLVGRAGQFLGNNLPRFAPGNNYIGLNLTSPVLGLPWRFWYTYLTGQPVSWNLGTERSVYRVNWRAIPFVQDPYGGSASQPYTVYGTGAQNAIIFDNGVDV